jgi:hypothetical protein
MKSKHVFFTLLALILFVAAPVAAQQVNTPGVLGTYTLPSDARMPSAPEFVPPRLEGSTAPAIVPAPSAPARAAEAPPASGSGGLFTPSVRNALADLLQAFLLALGGVSVAAWRRWVETMKARQKYDVVKTAIVAVDEAAETAFRLKWEAKSKYLVEKVRSGAISEIDYKREMEIIGNDALDLAKGIAAGTIKNVQDHVGDLDKQLRARLETLLAKAKGEGMRFFSRGNSPSAPDAATAGGSN